MHSWVTYLSYLGKFSTTSIQFCSITKFSLSLISQHPDFTSSSITMNVLPSGSYDVVTETGMPALSSTLISAIPITLTNQTYTMAQNYWTDVYYQTNSQSLSVTEKTSTQVLPDLSCSLSSSTSIVFSLGSFNSEVVQSWVAIDANTGMLNITSPEVEQDINYSFYVNAMITGLTLQTQKQIKLTVKDWSTWGSQTAKTLSITVQSIVGITMVFSVITSMLNVSSGSGIWLLINEVQLFFLLLLARAYIPDDVKLVITGFKFALNPSFYFPFNTMLAYKSVIDNFNFELSNYSLSYVGVSSDSSVYNTASFFVSLLVVIVCHLVVIVFMKLLSKCKTDWKWGWIVKIMIRITEKIYNLLSFSYYIRVALEINQFLLICSVYEIYSFNSSQPFRVVSFAFAIMILISWIFILTLAIYLSMSAYTVNEGKHNKLGEFFNGLKMHRKFKFYMCMLILRRTIFVVLLVTWISLSSRLLIGLLVLLQLIYLTYVCYLRPFRELKDNLTEIMNEVYFLLLLSSLVYLNEKSYWSSAITSIYMWGVCSNSMAALLISIGKTICQTYSWLRQNFISKIMEKVS